MTNPNTENEKILAKAKRNYYSNDQGVALIVVLAFVVLLTGLVVAYFSRSMSDRQLSSSSFSQAKADELARSALDILISDFKQEIVNGSTQLQGDPNNPNSNWTVIYQPTSGTYAVPVKNTPTNPISTLIRVSGTSPIAFPGVDQPASAALSTGTSANGRSVSMARWNQHYLLPRKNTGTTTDTTPVTTGSAAFTAPSWIYVTGSGGPANPALSNPSTQVMGRYAYAVYDESALLDLNVAGYPAYITGNPVPLPSGSAHPSPDPYNLKMVGYANKGSLAFADLTKLLPIIGSPSISAANMVKVVNNLLGWRNYATLQATGTYPNFTFTTAYSTTTPGVGSRYYDMVLTNKTGFLSTGTSTWNNSTDQAFLSRQQLINFILSGSTNATALLGAQDMLPYLGTFNRAVTGPSWSPSADASSITNPAGAVSQSGSDASRSSTPVPTGSNGAGNVYAYKTNAESTTAGGSSSPNGGHNPNRNLANVRWVQAGTITHYNDDGTTSTYTVSEGDVMLQRRFSLAKLAWLGHNGPNATAFNSSLTTAQQNAAIKACFGLVWKSNSNAASGNDTAPSSNARWEYASATLAQSAGGPGVYIKTLDQVASGAAINGSTADPSQSDPAREPNFFELLKAGILAGSLGQNPGMAAASTGPLAPGGFNPASSVPTSGTYGSYVVEPYHDPNWLEGAGGNKFEVYSADPDRHIIQIGANVVDQAKTDHYPTAIYLHNHTESGTDVGGVNFDQICETVYGDQNLPYIDRIAMLCYEDPLARDGAGASILNSGSAGDQNLKFWLSPEIWNPHQAMASSSGSVPSAFRIHMYGATWCNYAINAGGGSYQIMGENSTWGGAIGVSASGVTDFDAGTTTAPRYNTSAGARTTPLVGWGATTAPSTCKYLYFADSAANFVGTTFSNFKDPHLLVSSDLNVPSSAGTNDPLNYYNSGLATYINNSAGTAPVNTFQFSSSTTSKNYAGIYLGKADFPRSSSNIVYINPSTGVASGTYSWNDQVNFSTVTDPGENLTMSIDYYDGTSWLPYAFVPRITFCQSGYYFNGGWSASSGTNYVTPATYAGTLDSPSITVAVEPDPRTYRFSCTSGAAYNTGQAGYGNGAWPQGDTVAIDYAHLVGSNSSVGSSRFPCRSQGFSYISNPATTSISGGWGAGTLLYDWMVNNPAATENGGNTTLGGTSGGSAFNAYYRDADGVVRPGDNFRACTYGSAETGDGRYTYKLANNTGSAQNRRPIVLNRPLRSVGELGYAFRDLPGKNVDFWSTYSPDAALLDLFSVTDEPAVVAGQINPTNAPTAVLTAVLGRTMLNESQSPVINLDDNSAIATSGTIGSGTIAPQLAYYFSGTTAPHPLRNRADLVAAVSSVTDAILSGTGLDGTTFPHYTPFANKTFAEAPLRALSSVTNTRTWNLMIDVIAQAGTFGSNPPSSSNALNSSFVVQGEKRYWLHIAIDRYTGQVVDEQLEPVYE